MRKVLEEFVRKLVLGRSRRWPSAGGTPSEGVALKVRRGFFTETDVGGFFTLGGDNDYSNAADVPAARAGLRRHRGNGSRIGFHVGIGANAQNCWAGLNAAERLHRRSDNFTMTFLDVTRGVPVPVVERFYVAPQAGGGLHAARSRRRSTATRRPRITGGANVGVGVGIEYATNMDHFTIGADVLVRYVIGPNIPAISIFPRVKYTF